MKNFLSASYSTHTHILICSMHEYVSVLWRCELAVTKVSDFQRQACPMQIRKTNSCSGPNSINSSKAVTLSISRRLLDLGCCPKREGTQFDFVIERVFHTFVNICILGEFCILVGRIKAQQALNKFEDQLFDDEGNKPPKTEFFCVKSKFFQITS